MKSDLRIQELQADFSTGSFQFKRSAAPVQGGHGMHLAGTIHSRLNHQVQCRIRLDVVFAPAYHDRVNIRREIPRKKHDDVTVAGSKL